MSRPSLPSARQLEAWGIEARWSRLLDVEDSDGIANTWHVLDTGSVTSTGAVPIATIICVHGNPTWSFLWRSFLHQFGDRYRVIAVDQLGMGYSSRTARRRFAERVDDLGDVIDALGVDGPVVTAAHDWGGPISLGWVLRHRDQVKGVVLCNTGVAVPAGRRAPSVIRLAATGPITGLVGRTTRTFVDGTIALSRARISKIAREGYRAPYRKPSLRRAIADFVADVPFSPSYPSAAPIAAVAEGIRELTMPVLLAWGSKDPVFNDDFALDLAERLPQADRHRFPGLGHLVVEETDLAGLVDRWLNDRVFAADNQPEIAAATESDAVTEPATPPIWDALVRRSTDTTVAFIDGQTGESITFAELHDRVMGIAGGLIASGLQPGQRVAVLVPPSVDLLATVYGCWRAGAVTVIADRGLGLRGLGAAIRGAHVDWMIGTASAIAAARVLRWAPRATAVTVGDRAVPGSVATLASLVGLHAPRPAEPQPNDVAAVLYTSGATGPAKGVRYRHHQIVAQRDALRSVYDITAADTLVAAFAPFALYGPALGITSTIPDVDVTKPGTLTADALAAAVESVTASIVFASPAALANVCRTAALGDRRLSELRLVLSAGAPVPIATLRATAALAPNAELHTPYGMTECLPVADVELADRELADRELADRELADRELAGDSAGGAGVCVGRPVDGVEVMIAPLDFDAAEPVVAVAAGRTGEVLVRAPWLSDGYDQLWQTQYQARPAAADGRVWHRSGDVGRVDADRRLWIEGRNVHVIHTVDGPVTPVPIEIAVEQLDGIERAAAVGVGPRGVQQLVVVVENSAVGDGLADDAVAAAVRSEVEAPVAAVLTVGALPVDIRHNTKIDRVAVARWASAVLAGDRAKRDW
ncbi:MAG: alpha/beta fold hydrolase [Ilumatobacteraceae bacterium]